MKKIFFNLFFVLLLFFVGLKVVNSEETIISVDISWGNLDYDCVEGWDNQSHVKTYAWSPKQEGADQIEITNNSNVNVTASFEWTADIEHDDVVGTFKRNENLVQDITLLAKTVELTDSQTVKLDISGIPADPTNLEDNVFGSVSVIIRQETLLVNYDANGGVVTPTSKRVGISETYGTLPTPTKEGYTFGGWYTDSVGGNIVQSSTPVLVEADHSLYAHWSVNSYNLIIDPAGGFYDGSSSIKRGILDYNEIFNLSTIRRTGYTFTGWTSDVESSTVTDDILTMGSADTIITANWEPNKQKLTVDPAGGIWNDNEEPQVFNMDYDEEKTIANPTRAGYTFVGWTKTGTGSVLDGTTFIMAGEDSTLTAKWILNDYKYIVYHRQENFDGSGYTLIEADTNEGWEGYGKPLTPSPRIYNGFKTPTPQTITIVDAESNNIVTYDYDRETYNLTIDPAGGIYEESNETQILPTKFGVSKTMSTPTRLGWTFDGWTVDSGELNGNIFTIGAGNATLTATWVATTQIVRYDANGGLSPESSKVVTYGNQYGELAVPTRQGYTFEGWYTAKTEGEQITETTEVTITEDQTIYARWSANAIIVTYDANGGEALDPTSKNVTYDTNYGTLPTPVKTGYTFIGWFNNATGGSIVQADSRVKNANDHTIYARWIANTYTLNYDVNGGNEISPTSKIVTYDSLYGLLPNPEKVGYTFLGWYTEITGGTKIEDSTTVTNWDAHTLYGHWSANTYTITYNINGGEIFYPITKTVTYDETYGELTTPSRNGWTFEGWYTLATGGEKIEATTLVSITTDQMIYAHWTANEYTVTYDPNGGDEITPSSKEVTFDTVYGELVTPTRAGYTFNGWWTTLTGGTKVSNDIVVSNPSNHTIYAHWTPKTYVLTYDSNGGDSILDNIVFITYGENYENMPTPTKTGHSFIGWYTESVDGDKIEENDEITIVGNHRLYAHWSVNTYTVNYDVNGGNTLNPSSKEVTYDSTYQTLPIPTKTGWTFLGWWTTNDDEATKVEETTKVTKTENHTIYAKWTANTYTVTFDVNSGDELDTNTKVVTYNEAYGELQVPTKTGYRFAGWYTEATDGTQVLTTDTVTATNNHTLYAHWIPKEYTITFDMQGGSGGEASDTATYERVIPSVAAPTREGYDFGGYYTETNGAGTKYYNADGTSDKVWNIAENTTLYAYWIGKQYTITLYAFGDTNGTASVIATYGSPLPDIVLPSRRGFGATGFKYGYDEDLVMYYDENGKGIRNWDIDSDTQLDVVYEGLPYTITFDMQGGSGGTESIGVVYDKLPPNITVPTRAGYTFKGYFTETGGEGTRYYEADGQGKYNRWWELDATLYAYWTANEYTLTLDKQGGTIDWSTENITVKATYGSDLPRQYWYPSKQGYTFGGYFTEKNGAGTKYYNADGTSAKAWDIASNDITLYANWIIETYTITFDVNDGDELETNTKVVTYNETYGELPEPTKTGYSFAGWWTSKYTGTQVLSTDTVTTTNNQTLYAHWNVNQYTITFDKQGGNINGNVANQTATATYGSAMPDITTPIRIGYTFGGYYTEANGGGTCYYDSIGMSENNWNIAENTTLYAYWTAKTYTVTLNKQGGNIDGNTSNETKTAAYGSAMPSVTAPTKEGYTFGGYFTEKNGAGTKYYNADGTSAKAWDYTEAKILYAHWLANTYTVTFDVNGGNELETNTKVVTYDETYGELPEPTKTGYNFEGWYTETTAGTKVLATDTVTVTSNKTLYAYWTATTYTVTLDKQGGNIDGNTANETTTATYESAMSSVTAPTKDGYTFGGYYTEANGVGTKYYNADGTSAKAWDIAENTTLYAKWTAKTYTVTLDKQGGNIDGNTTNETTTITYGSTMSSVTAPTKDGYTFGGYYTETNGAGTKYYNVYGTSAKAWDIAENTTLYAHWLANTYTITFDVKGGNELETNTKVVTYDETYGELPEPTKTGYSFEGWYTQATDGTKVLSTDTVTITSNKLLYAHWTVN